MAVLKYLLASIFLISVAGLAHAQHIGPDPALAPEDVIAIQLSALQNNDNPTPNAGIAQTFALAHPDNKRMTGPLARFELMIRSQAYRPLLGHRAHQITRVDGDDNRIQYLVVIETPNGLAVQYLWEVARVNEGTNAGAWLTTNVSAPMKAGQSL